MYTQIIILDDDPIFRLITIKMIKMLEIASLKIHECNDGETGLSLLEQLTETNDKVIIFLDINLPFIDSWNFLERLKTKNNFDIKNLLLYLVSSSTDHSDILKAKNYGVIKEFLHKPLNLFTIKSIITEN